MLKNTRGQALMIIIVFLSVIFMLSMGLISYVMNNRVVTQRIYRQSQASNVAEAGIDKAVWCLNNTSVCGLNYTGETSTLGSGSYTTTVSNIGQDYTVVSTGTVGSIQKIIKSTITQSTTSSGASFFYGVQVGAGGLEMDNNSFVQGNIYSNGSITAGNGAYATGDVYVAGGTALTTDQAQILQSSDFNFGRSTATDIAQSFKPSITEVINKVSLYLKKVSAPSNGTVYITEDNNGKPKTTSLTSGTLNASLITSSYGWVDVTFNSNPILTKNETYWIVVDVGSNNSQYFISGLHDNAGYGNGTGVYSLNWSGGSWSSANGDFSFKTWMGGLITSIDGLQVGDKNHTCDNAHYATHHGDAHAHRILNSKVECDAFYFADPGDISGTTVGRTKHADSADSPPENMPVSDGQIVDWKAEAAAGGTITGDYTLTNGATASLGPKKITGNMLIDNNSTLTITGTIWVVGNVTFSNGVTISLDPGYNASSGLMLSDGLINVTNNVIFYGSGTSGSYIMILTTNDSLIDGAPAININNNAETVIFYAGNGLINIANNAHLKEATGFKLHLAENSYITYEQGLANANFANGPGGIWKVQSKSWLEIK